MNSDNISSCDLSKRTAFVIQNDTLHCILCDRDINDETDHRKTKQHAKMVSNLAYEYKIRKMYIENSTESFLEYKGDEMFTCTLCDKLLDTHTIESHISSKSHLMNESHISEKEIFASETTRGNRRGFIKPPGFGLVLDENVFVCELCGPKHRFPSIRAFALHIIGDSTHTKRLQEMISQRLEYWQPILDSDVSKLYFLEHTSGKIKYDESFLDSDSMKEQWKRWWNHQPNGTMEWVCGFVPHQSTRKLTKEVIKMSQHSPNSSLFNKFTSDMFSESEYSRWYSRNRVYGNVALDSCLKVGDNADFDSKASRLLVKLDEFTKCIEKRRNLSTNGSRLISELYNVMTKLEAVYATQLRLTNDQNYASAMYNAFNVESQKNGGQLPGTIESFEQWYTSTILPREVVYLQDLPMAGQVRMICNNTLNTYNDFSSTESHYFNEIEKRYIYTYLQKSDLLSNQEAQMKLANVTQDEKFAIDQWNYKTMKSQEENALDVQREATYRIIEAETGLENPSDTDAQETDNTDADNATYSGTDDEFIVDE